MFTGIVEAIGNVIEASSSALVLEAPLDGLFIGDSLSVNGVCLTVVTAERHGAASRYAFDVSEETIKVTSLGSLAAGSRVNLERAMAADGRFGGHIVQGHVDGVGVVTDVTINPSSTEITFSAPDHLLGYLVPKGSVAIDGVSLTVAELAEPRFTVALIPHTLASTNLSERRTGDRVNLETDILAKYLERLYRKER